ncbi:hypothetical protein TSAR_002651 [Trichomalopsis sarcophagae]|uniref:Transmembrane protein n=1 Tax=Trichomalopsis sarcophagae TaxID=543379 RepID=A0A232F6F7_9HYME|nr:hypothetical protein TSAR_002651 [Trichomalopsis sarcophagae]
MCDFLPSSVHKILADVEFSLSLPILFVIGMCTIHLAVNHSMHIACNVKEIMRKRSEKSRKQRKCVKEGPGMMERIKAFASSFFSKSNKISCPEKPRKCIKSKPACKRSCGDKGDLKFDGDDDWDDEEDDDMVDLMDD